MHGCSACKWLGQYKEYDLYVCIGRDSENQSVIDSVIARNGEDGEYKSGTHSAITRVFLGDFNDPLVEALRRAFWFHFILEPNETLVAHFKELVCRGKFPEKAS